MKMNRKTVCTLCLSLFVIVIVFPKCDSQNLVSNLASTAKIVLRLCYLPGVNSEKIAKGFIGCYDHAPGKWQYFTCQKRANGYLLDTKDHIDEAVCKSPWRTPKYIQCLMQEFEKANIDLNKATAKVNECQSRVVGVS